MYCIVIVQHPQGRCIQVVVLASASRPDERDHRCADDHERDGEDEVNDTHGDVSNDRLRHDARSTVRELAGMRMAAISGLIVPVIASDAPTAL